MNKNYKQTLFSNINFPSTKIFRMQQIRAQIESSLNFCRIVENQCRQNQTDYTCKQKDLGSFNEETEAITNKKKREVGEHYKDLLVFPNKKLTKIKWQQIHQNFRLHVKKNKKDFRKIET